MIQKVGFSGPGWISRLGGFRSRLIWVSREFTSRLVFRASRLILGFSEKLSSAKCSSRLGLRVSRLIVGKNSVQDRNSGNVFDG